MIKEKNTKSSFLRKIYKATRKFFGYRKYVNKRIDYLENQLKRTRTLAENVAFSFPMVFDQYIQLSKKSDKLAVYTGIIGEYDNLNTPLVVDDNCDYFCFTDNINLKSDFWNVILIDKNNYPEISGLDNTRVARYIKMHPHLLLPQYEHTLFVDANLTITRSVWMWIALYSTGKDILTFLHPDRRCIYEEAEVCKSLAKDDADLLDRVIKRYKKEGFPKQFGLTMTCALYRKNTEQAKRFNELWWNEIKNHSKRDQMSFMYLCWKEGFEYDVCPLNAYKNDFFHYGIHNNLNCRH